MSDAAAFPDFVATVETTTERNVAITIDGVCYVMTPSEARRLAELILKIAGSSFHRTQRLEAIEP